MSGHYKLLSLISVLLCGFSAASAHHGLVNYDTTRLLEFEGRVIDFRLMDPHSILVVETRSSDGSVSVWEVEGGSASGLVGSGISQEFLRSRPTVQIKAFQTKDGLCSPRCRAAGEDFEFARNQ